jgi:hypothetical protein
LAVLGLSTKPGGNIAHRADRRIAGAFGKPDLAERRVTLGDTGAKPQIAATFAPAGDQLARRLTHRYRHLDRAFCRVRDRHRVIEKHHDAVARELVERSFILADQRSQRAMVLAQEVEHLLGLGGLGKGGVAAQITEHDDDLAAMTFENFLVALRDDQLRQLRREEPLQSPDPPQLLDLFGDPRFETAVQLRYLIGALTQLTQQPRVLHCDNRLRREILQQ